MGEKNVVSIGKKKKKRREPSIKNVQKGKDEEKLGERLCPKLIHFHARGKRITRMGGYNQKPQSSHQGVAIET